MTLACKSAVFLSDMVCGLEQHSSMDGNYFAEKSFFF